MTRRARALLCPLLLPPLLFPLLLLAVTAGLALLAGCDGDGTGGGPGPTPTPPGGSRNMTLLATLELARGDGRRGFNADLALHRGFAYVGTWGRGAAACPGSSVKVVDVRDPARPRQVANLAEHPGTTSEDVVVRAVATPAFRGDLLVAGLQACAAGGLSGVDVWDVTRPEAPAHLATFDVGDDVHGVHELDLEARGARAFAYLAVPGGEFGRHEAGMLVLDLTDPRRPELRGSFGLPRDLGEPAGGEVFVHSVRADAPRRRALVSYWDAGVLVLDVSDVDRPRLLGRTPVPASADGNAHSVALAREGALLLECDEDDATAPRGPVEPGSGYVRVHDLSGLDRIAQIGELRTAGSRLHPPPGPGSFTVHNVEMAGELAHASWYAEGVRVFDVSDPRSPAEVAFLVPPARPDPFGVLPTAPWVWGVAVEGDLVLASDINAGLHVIRRH